MEGGMKAISVILAVDRNHRNLELLSQFLEREAYQTRMAATLEEFDQSSWIELSVVEGDDESIADR
jgi:CheY-like chemotaxis protein